MVVDSTLEFPPPSALGSSSSLYPDVSESRVEHSDGAILDLLWPLGLGTGILSGKRKRNKHLDEVDGTSESWLLIGLVGDIGWRRGSCRAVGPMGVGMAPGRGVPARSGITVGCSGQLGPMIRTSCERGCDFFREDYVIPEKTSAHRCQKRGTT